VLGSAYYIKSKTGGRGEAIDGVFLRKGHIQENKESEGEYRPENLKEILQTLRQNQGWEVMVLCQA